MIHARKDYDRIQDPDNKIPMDEPVFLIRGQDPIGAVVVRYWAELHAGNAIEDGVHPSSLTPLMNALNLHAAKMERWARHVNHGPANVDPNNLRQI